MTLPMAAPTSAATRGDCKMGPCILFGMYNVGWQKLAALGQPTPALACFMQGALHMLPIILVSYIAGGIWEVTFAIVRKHEINEGFLVTGMLFPLTCPPTLPLWMVAAGITFGVVIGKEVFGERLAARREPAPHRPW